MKLNEYMRVSSLFFYLMLCGLTERIFEMRMRTAW